MRTLFGELRYALRTLANTPGFTAVAIATLAVGIGANTAIFSFVDGILLKPLPYPESERIMRVLEKPPRGARNGISTLNFLDWKRENTVFEHLAAQTGGSVTLTGVDSPVRLRGARASVGYFEVFGIQPALGRAFAPGEDQMGATRVAVIANALWKSQFGGDPAVVGRTIQLDNEPTTIVGILPAGGAFDRAYPQIWRPLVFEPQNMTRNYHWFGSYGRLKKGVTLKQARAQMDAIGARIAQEFPDSNKGWGVVIEPYAETLAGPQLRQSLYVLLAAVGAVLLIGCVNLANLTLARGTSREREVAIRLSLGAGRWTLVRQFLQESILLSAAGGVLGIGVGYATLVVLKAALPPYTFAREAAIEMDGRAILFALGVSALTAILCGLAPAIQATRPDLAGSIKEGGRGSSGGGSRQRVRSALVVAEVALAFMLLTAAGLLIRSFFAMGRVDPGFDSTNVITAGLPVPEKRFTDPEQLSAYLREIVSGVQALPGVRDVALTSALPMQGWGYGMPFQIADQPLVDRANRQACFFKMVSPSYFRALGMRLRKGRPLDDRDGKGAPHVTVINENMARRYFREQEPVGKRILIQEIVPGKTQLGPEIAWEVVGVVADEAVGYLGDTDGSPGVYVPMEQSPVFGPALLVRGNIDPASLTQPMRKAVLAVNKDQALTDIRTLEKIKADSIAADRLRFVLITVFAAIAALLAAIGIYGVVSYSVAQRTHEIGIRAALGASAREIVTMVLRGGMLMTAIGLALGLAGALAMAQLLRAMLFGVQSRDPITICAVAVLLAAAALAASYLPALRAGRVDPMKALRCE